MIGRRTNGAAGGAVWVYLEEVLRAVSFDNTYRTDIPRLSLSFELGGDSFGWAWYIEHFLLLLLLLLLSQEPLVLTGGYHFFYYGFFILEEWHE